MVFTSINAGQNAKTCLQSVLVYSGTTLASTVLCFRALPTSIDSYLYLLKNMSRLQKKYKLHD